MTPKFSWDPRKAEANVAKHRVSFVEASSVFDDPLGQIFDDEEHSVEERRELLVGHSAAGRLLIVCFAELQEGLIRIITARLATRREQRDYGEQFPPRA